MGTSDPSVHRRPAFAPAQQPHERTALKDRWNANQRVFANPDGTVDVQLGKDLNFKDANGEWQAVDLSLVDAGNGHFHPTAAPEALELNDNSGDAGIASLTGDDGLVG